MRSKCSSSISGYFASMSASTRQALGELENSTIRFMYLTLRNASGQVFGIFNCSIWREKELNMAGDSEISFHRRGVRRRWKQQSARTVKGSRSWKWSRRNSVCRAEVASPPAMMSMMAVSVRACDVESCIWVARYSDACSRYGANARCATSSGVSLPLLLREMLMNRDKVAQWLGASLRPSPFESTNSDPCCGCSEVATTGFQCISSSGTSCSNKHFD